MTATKNEWFCSYHAYKNGVLAKFGHLTLESGLSVDDEIKKNWAKEEVDTLTLHIIALNKM